MIAIDRPSPTSPYVGRLALALSSRGLPFTIGSGTLWLVDQGSEMFRHLPFPFDGNRFPSSLGAVIQLTVLNGHEPAREVIHALDGSWLVGDGINDPNVPGAVVASHIAHAIDRNPSMAELATMRPGSIATRSGPGDAWVIERHTWSPEPSPPEQ